MREVLIDLARMTAPRAHEVEHVGALRRVSALQALRLARMHQGQVLARRNPWLTRQSSSIARRA